MQNAANLSIFNSFGEFCGEAEGSLQAYAFLTQSLQWPYIFPQDRKPNGVQGNKRRK